jgi:hypothetical protein
MERNIGRSRALLPVHCLSAHMRKSSNPEQVSCANCERSLRRLPIIRVERRCFCYLCAAQKIKRTQRVLTRAFEEVLSQYRLEAERFSKWEAELHSHELPEIVAIAIIGCTISVGFWCAFQLPGRHYVIASACAFFAGRSVVWAINLLLRANFKKRNPMPKNPGRWPPLYKFVYWDFELIDPHRSRTIKGDYRSEILIRDQLTWQSCGETLAANQLEVHHVRPTSQNGRTCPTNLITLCIKCHEEDDWFGHRHYRAGRRPRIPGMEKARKIAKLKNIHVPLR